MELSRRDALAALSAAGIGAAGGGTGPAAESGAGATAERAPDLSRADRETLVAVARVVYPSEVAGVAAFVETYVAGRVAGRPDHRAGLVATLADLDEHAVAWFDAPVAGLPPERRDSLLRQVGADTAEPVPDGTVAERVRYYVVDDLLYALYTSPAGGRLVGTENPPGHPGGLASYRRGPADRTGSRDRGGAGSAERTGGGRDG